MKQYMNDQFQWSASFLLLKSQAISNRRNFKFKKYKNGKIKWGGEIFKFHFSIVKYNIIHSIIPYGMDYITIFFLSLIYISSGILYIISMIKSLTCYFFYSPQSASNVKVITQRLLKTSVAGARK